MPLEGTEPIKDKPLEGTEPIKDKPLEGDFKEQPSPDAQETERALAVVQTPQQLAGWRPRLAKEIVDEQIEQREQRLRFYKEVMKDGVDFSIIPGQRPTPRIDQSTGQVMRDSQGKDLTDAPKPALLKPGAEKLNAALGLHAILPDRARYPDLRAREELRGDEWYIVCESYCEIRVQTGPGPSDYMVVAGAGGSCNSWEEKYRYRGGGRKCPECGAEGTIIKGNPQYAPKDKDGHKQIGFEQGGWLCWKKKDGCGTTFVDSDRRITEQEIAKTKNTNPHDLLNTLEKMADKRALVAATLIATGCSDLFTQDVEEKANGGADEPRPAPSAKEPPRPRTPMDEATVLALKVRIKELKEGAEHGAIGADAAWLAWTKWMKVVGSYDALFADEAYLYNAKNLLGITETAPKKEENVAGQPLPHAGPSDPVQARAADAPNKWHDQDKTLVRETVKGVQRFVKDKDPHAVAVLRAFTEFMNTHNLDWTGQNGHVSLWSKPELRDELFKILELPDNTKADPALGFDPEAVPE